MHLMLLDSFPVAALGESSTVLDLDRNIVIVVQVQEATGNIVKTFRSGDAERV